MIGIYKITNKINNKSYIGQSKDIESRFKEHIQHTKTNIGKEIQKYGINNFSFDVLEQCSIEMLNEREAYYIKKYNSIENGYNILPSGKLNFGENNPNSKLTEKDVYDIRKAYNNHKNMNTVYEIYKDKVSYYYFRNIWEGRSWIHILPEVYNWENKLYYKKQTSIGDKSATAIFTDDEVIVLRERYVNETAKSIYESVKDRCSFQTLQQILWGRYYSHLKIYDKKAKKWIIRIFV